MERERDKGDVEGEREEKGSERNIEWKVEREGRRKRHTKTNTYLI